ncbi:hypothetical protein CAPTEDRAFT_223246 [Capitella teleta]|uniref:SCP domain-containing protein n=1 Tax=Capitella teleta TaxID=283909 RepID=R7TX28_CAPTE|nr:hypothetical protein CAPTEDRAFT_223246 [Capitella teleta]|eukprot:ELT95996.1 hypothetical protein CAPTEDRAFT_223246 [Capitella teleta]
MTRLLFSIATINFDVKKARLIWNTWLIWNNELTAMAEEWAKTCYWGHGQPLRDDPPFENIGQNLYAFNGTFDPLVGIQAFYDEKPYYDYETGDCSLPPCGHYTQVVWSTSKYVGCAYSYCPRMQPIDLINANYLVCNYGPAGNWNGQKPFKKGEACTKCSSGEGWCVDGLCVELDDPIDTEFECHAKCENCGERIYEKEKTCRCQCKRGWTGPDCSDACEDRHENCGANPGWPYYWCDRDYVRDNCPVLCGLCEAGTSECKQTTTPSTETQATTTKIQATTNAKISTQKVRPELVLGVSIINFLIVSWSDISVHSPLRVNN